MGLESVIQVSEMSKIYRSGLIRRRRFQALRNVSLDVPKGRIFGLLGPNGAGKTTLIKILLGIVRPTSGKASVLGFSAGSLAARRRIGYLPENHRIPGHLTGNSALEYYGALSNMALSEIRRLRPDLLKMVGLQGRGREAVSGYSKGMLQRLGLAQAMLHNPELIILDEPTDGVDPVGRKEIRDVLRDLAARGTTIFLNSHLLQEIELICDSVAIMTNGEVRRTGSVQELKQVITDAPLRLQLSGEQADIINIMKHRDGFVIRCLADRTFEVETRITSQQMQDQLVDDLRTANISISQMNRRELTLEEAFIEIVGAHS